MAFITYFGGFVLKPFKSIETIISSRAVQKQSKVWISLVGCRLSIPVLEPTTSRVLQKQWFKRLRKAKELFQVMGNKKTGHLNPIGRFWARFSLQKNTIKDIMEAIDGTGR